MAVPIRKTTNATTAGNIQNFDANGNPIYAISAFRWAFKTGVPTVIYLGEASIGSSEAWPVWRITEIDTAAGSFKYADSGNETQVWSNREALVYL